MPTISFAARHSKKAGSHGPAFFAGAFFAGAFFAGAFFAGAFFAGAFFAGAFFVSAFPVPRRCRIGYRSAMNPANVAPFHAIGLCGRR